jgi:hypothetical protein
VLLGISGSRDECFVVLFASGRTSTLDQAETREADMQEKAHHPFDQDQPPKGPSAALPPAPPPGNFRSGKRGKAWERGWAITGIVWAFFWFVIPGLLAIGAYRRWQRGERERPLGLIIFGIVFTAYVVGGSLLMGMTESWS